MALLLLRATFVSPPPPTALRRLPNPSVALPSPLHRKPNPSPPRRLVVLRASVDPRSPIDRRKTGFHPLLQLAVSVVLFFAGLGAATACADGRSAPAAIQEVASTSDDASSVKAGKEDGEWDEETEREFEAFKSKKLSWTVPLRVVALRGSFPASWFKDFVQAQSKRLKLQPEFRASLQAIHQQLALEFNNASIKPKSLVAADVVTIGDRWLSHAIQTGIIEPISGAGGEQWFNGLSNLWKVYLRRNEKGELDSNGSIWGAPYRWGTVVIAYKKDKFKRNNLASIEDWGDLWRPELAGKISMIASPREVVGSVLKYMGASYNTKDIDLEVAGGRDAVMKNLALLQRQVRLFDDTHYLKAFTAGDVWVAVGWSSDVLATAKRVSNVAVIVPKSGTSIWADIWAVPAASKLDTDQIGGRVRGPSPLIHQWIDFCLQPARAFAFEQEIIPGATPSALNDLPGGITPPDGSVSTTTGRPMLDTNLVSGVPPPEVLPRCEFVEPLSEKASMDYRWLIENMQRRPSGNFVSYMFDKLISTIRVKFGHSHIGSVST